MKLSLLLSAGSILLFSNVSAAYYYCDVCEDQYDYYNQPNYSYYDKPHYSNRPYYSNRGNNQNYYPQYYTERDDRYSDRGQRFINKMRDERSMRDDRSWRDERSMRSQDQFDEGRGEESFDSRRPGERLQAFKDSFKTQDDKDLLMKIRRAIANERDLQPRSLSIEVVDLNVTLKGRLSPEKAERIENLIRELNDVADVDNRIETSGETEERADFRSKDSSESNLDTRDDATLRSNFRDDATQRTDFRSSKYSADRKDAELSHENDHMILSRIQDAIEKPEAGKSFKNVNLRVTKGIVTITGTVMNERDHQALRNRIQQIQGVRDLNDQLQVSGE